MGKSLNKPYWRSRIGEAWTQSWRFEKAESLRDCGVLALFGFILFVAGLWPKEWGDVLEIVGFPLLAILAYAVVRFLRYFLFVAPAKMHDR
jgi:hypothetical protein